MYKCFSDSHVLLWNEKRREAEIFQPLELHIAFLWRLFIAFQETRISFEGLSIARLFLHYMSSKMVSIEIHREYSATLLRGQKNEYRTIIRVHAYSDCLSKAILVFSPRPYKYLLLYVQYLSNHKAAYHNIKKKLLYTQTKFISSHKTLWRKSWLSTTQYNVSVFFLCCSAIFHFPH